MLDFLHHLFIPRESNNHRARVLHAKPLFLLLSILLLLNFTLPLLEQRFPDVLGVEANISVEELLELTNQRRAEVGLSPVVLDMQLSQAANMKAHDMFAKDYWSHNSPEGTTPWVFIKSSGYSYMYAGENLARGFTTANDAVNAWMASPGHRDNILSPNYKEIGFAIVPGTLTGDDTILIVQMFGSKMISAQHIASAQQVLPTDPPSPSTSSPVPTNVAQANITIAPTIVVENPIIVDQKGDSNLFVASIQNDPWIDRANWTRIAGISLAILFICLFVVDMILIEKKKIVRIVSHNVDHIMFITIILLTLILFGNGVIL